MPWVCLWRLFYFFAIRVGNFFFFETVLVLFHCFQPPYWCLVYCHECHYSSYCCNIIGPILGWWIPSIFYPNLSLMKFHSAGDQGFLNSYYSDFPNAHLFKPNIPLEVVKSQLAPEMERLSTLYNADVGLYMLANKVLIFQMFIFYFCLCPVYAWFQQHFYH